MVGREHFIIKTLLYREGREREKEIKMGQEKKVFCVCRGSEDDSKE